MRRPRREVKYDGLTSATIGAYGIGHVLNDLCGAAWFGFFLYYIVNIRGVSDMGAGGIILAGQVADSIATPISGILSDRMDTPLGKRTPLYIFGSVTVVLSFFFLWQECYLCLIFPGTSGLALFWYCLYASIFNIGFACVQVTNLSLIPSLTPLKERKDRLIGLRTAFTYISNIAVLTFALILFNVLRKPKTQFSVLSLMVLTIGITTSIIYVFLVNEVKLTSIAKKNYQSLEEMASKGKVNVRESLTSSLVSIKEESIEDILNSLDDEDTEIQEYLWKDWVKMKQLYVTAVIYTMSRLANNVFSSLLPFYLVKAVSVGKSFEEETPWQLAFFPMCLYLGSMSTSLLVKKLGEKIDRIFQYITGTVLVVIGCIPMPFVDSTMQFILIPIMLTIGIGLSLLLNNSFGFISAFIGSHGSSGAFVWGAASFLDKLSTGLALFLISSLGNLDNSTYISISIVGLPILSSIIGGLTCGLIRRTPEFTAS